MRTCSISLQFGTLEQDTIFTKKKRKLRLFFFLKTIFVVLDIFKKGRTDLPIGICMFWKIYIKMLNKVPQG